MAEQVQAVLDRMVEGLHDLQERGVFASEEIQAVVARRRTSEYLLRRRNPRKHDYLQYIQAETDLERLRQLRTNRMKREQQQNGLQLPSNEQTKHVGDKHVIQHLHLLWVRMLRKYRSDVDLYLQYAAFCKESKSFKRLAACYQEALRFHPNNTVLWIEAASHEFFENHSCQNARILLQRALRLHPGAADLWVQSFVLEMHFVQKMRGRRAILLGSEADDDEKSADDTSYNIAMLVYDNAIQSAADSVSIRLTFLDQCGHFPDTSTVESHILSTIERDYADSPSAWIARAVYYKINTKGLVSTMHGGEQPQVKRRRTCTAKTPVCFDPVLETIREACSTLRTEEMFLQSVRFLQDNAFDGKEKDEEGGGGSVKDCSITAEKMSATHALIRELLSDAAGSSDICSSTLALQYADYLVKQSETAAAIAVLQHFVDNARDATKITGTVFLRWAGLIYEKDDNEAFQILEKGLKVISMHQSDYMDVLLQLLAARLQSASLKPNETDHNIVSELFQRLLLLSPGFKTMKNVEHPVVATLPNLVATYRRYIRYVLDQNGMTSFRRACDSVLFQSSLVDQLTAIDADSVKLLLDEVITVEQAEFQSASTRSNRSRLARLYDVAMQIFRGTTLATIYRQRREDEVLYR